jgi:toxin-antitoxin system PIN domain toxin
MSYSIDANVLLFASDRASTRHDAACAFLESCATSQDTLCLTWLTLMAYVRIATHPKIFSAPLAPEHALANVNALLSMPRTRVVTEQGDFMNAYRHVTAGLIVHGNLVPDAHVATILFQHGVRTLYSHDRDFRTFLTLEVIDPFA